MFNIYIISLNEFRIGTRVAVKSNDRYKRIIINGLNYYIIITHRQYDDIIIIIVIILDACRAWASTKSDVKKKMKYICEENSTKNDDNEYE